jgi:hypothetical protein
MTDLPQREEVIKRRVRFVVPAREPWGLPIKDLRLAIKHALDDRERRGLSNDFDDALRFVAEDGDGGEIVIFYDVEEPAKEQSAFAELPFLNPCPHDDEHSVTICWPGRMEHLERDHRVRVVVHACGRIGCQKRIGRQIQDITGHVASVEEYPKP